MDISQLDVLMIAIEETAVTLVKWGLSQFDWCLLDGPAIKLCNSLFDSSKWRDHLNVYVTEATLPWKTSEREQTIPPKGSEALHQLFALAEAGIRIHLVPAGRYFAAGFARQMVKLPSGQWVQAATLSGCAQVWSYKSVELLDRIEDFHGDVERIADERIERLAIAANYAEDTSTKERVLILMNGYKALRSLETQAALDAFLRAAGPTWERLRTGKDRTITSVGGEHNEERKT